MARLHFLRFCARYFSLPRRRHSKTTSSTSSSSTSSPPSSFPSATPTTHPPRPKISAPIQIPSLVTTVYGPTPNLLLPPDRIDNSPAAYKSSSVHSAWDAESESVPSSASMGSRRESREEDGRLGVERLEGGNREMGGRRPERGTTMVRRRNTVKEMRRRSGRALSTYSTHSRIYAPL